MNSPVAVNFERCHEVASVIKRMRLPQKLVRQTIFSSDRKLVGNFNLFLVAICHQTKQIGGTVNGKWYRGWDYLRERLNDYCRTNIDILEVGSWSRLSHEYFERTLSPAMQVDLSLGARSRVPLINDLGYHMTRAGYSSFEELYDAANQRCCGAQSIMSFLKCTKAYSDPVEKKLRLLIGLLRDAHGWEFPDAHELGAPVDYHEIRGHIRIGTIVINDSILSDKFRSDCISDCEDSLIRVAVSTAMEAIARDIQGGDPLKIHYILWKYFRAICKRDEPNCRMRADFACGELDQTWVESFRMSGRQSGCVFAEFCDGLNGNKFWPEYSYNGTYY